MKTAIKLFALCMVGSIAGLVSDARRKEDKISALRSEIKTLKEFKITEENERYKEFLRFQNKLQNSLWMQNGTTMIVDGEVVK